MRYSEEYAPHGPRMASTIAFTYGNGTNFRVALSLVSQDVAMRMCVEGGSKQKSLKSIKGHVKNKMGIYETFVQFSEDHPEIIEHYKSTVDPDYDLYKDILEDYILAHTSRSLEIPLDELPKRLATLSSQSYDTLVYKEVSISFREFLMNIFDEAQEEVT